MLLTPIEGGRVIISDERMLEWIAERIHGMGLGYKWQMASAIGLGARGRIIAGMAIHDYQPRYNSCELTLASDTPAWATRTSIRAMLAYPFEQLGIRRITTIVAESNLRAIRLAGHLGFLPEGRCRFGCGDEDALIFGILREETPSWMNFTSTTE